MASPVTKEPPSRFVLSFQENNLKIIIPFDIDAMKIQYGAKPLRQKLEIFSRLLDNTCTAEDLQEIEAETFLPRDPRSTGRRLYLNFLRPGCPFLEWDGEKLTLYQHAEFGRPVEDLAVVHLPTEFPQKLIPSLLELASTIN